MKFFITLSFLSLTLFSKTPGPLDLKLKEYIKEFNFKPLETPTGFNRDKFILGRSLFFEKALSGNKNISCADCHHPRLATGDALPLSIGEGGIGLGEKRTMGPAHVIPRNANPLFNLGLPGVKNLFWDGRVSYDEYEETFETPEKALNGYNPPALEIVEALDDALSAQALFPILSREEMRGQIGSNDVANAKDNLQAWKILTKRITDMSDYMTQLKKVYPNVDKFNIGHIGSAIAHFEKYAFTANNTAWDQYLRGNLSIMSAQEKRGAIVFAEKGLCARCHNGPHLSNFKFENVAAPQIGPGKDKFKNDEGRFLITGKDEDRYKFRVPPLRNIGFTAPYFHTGTALTLEEVVEHYTKGANSMDTYSTALIDKKFKTNYGKNLFQERDRYKLFKKKVNAHPIVRGKIIRLSEQEKQDLVYFLRYSLLNRRRQ